MRVLPYLILLFFAGQCGRTRSPNKPEPANRRPPLLVDIRDLANQTQEDIATLLGPQSSLTAEDAEAAVCATCQKYSYQNDRIVIEYTNDMADRITLRPPPGTRAEATPALLGLPPSDADEAEKDKLRWRDFAGIREVTAFRKKDGTVEYIVVKVLTL